MSKFNTKKNNTTTNLAGGKAFKMDAEQELLHAVLTTFLEDKYYETGNERIDRIVNLIKQASPEYVANLAYVARTEFHLRSVPIILLGELAKVHKGDSLVRTAIEKTVQRVDDITELVAYLDAKLPKQVKRGIRRALYKFSPYQIAKYRAEGKDVSLVDVFNLVHPKPQFATREQAKAWKDLIDGNLKSTGQTWEATISTTEDKKESWEKLIMENKLGYMATLRNINNFIKNDIDPVAKNMVIDKLTNREQVKRSKQLPFRFVTAYDNVEDREYRDAISIAMDHAVDNVPELPGKTLIAIDVSGSMGGGWINYNASTSIKKASIFGASLAKANRLADIVLFDDEISTLPVSSRIPVIDIAKQIEDNARGGGTNTSLVFRLALDNKKVYDRIIIISDDQSWQDSTWGWGNGGTQQSYNRYKKEMEADPYVYAIDIEGYGTKNIESPRVFYLTGWSNRLLDFIGLNEKEGMVEYVRNLDIYNI